MLGIKEKNVQEYIENGFHFYARLLGVRKDSEKLLSAVAKKGELPLLAQLSQTQALSPLGQRMLRHDILASNLYTSVVTDKFKTAFRNEYSQPVIKV